MWETAIEEELKAHEENETWKIVHKPRGRQTIDSKWVFKVQQNKNGQTNRYKARLCARGFLQQHGIDYGETFAPVVRYTTIRVMLALAAQENLEMRQFDICTAFLYGKLEEEIYMRIPEGLHVNPEEGDACLLNKSLYGLKQASRCWNKTFTSFLEEYNFQTCASDNSLFVGEVNKCRVYIVLFVDDGLVLSKSLDIIDYVIGVLELKFRIKVSEPDVFVGIQIEKCVERGQIFIHQSNYTKRVLEKFRMSDCNSVSTPIEPGVSLCVNRNGECKSIPYREAVGSLMFLSIVSRPDIPYAVNYLSRFLNGYDNSHWEVVKRVFRYLKGTCDLGIMYTRDKVFDLMAYSDSDYAGDLESRRSTSGNLFILSNGPVSWLSQRQPSVTLSTTEAEYVAACMAARETVWLRRLLSDIGHPCACRTMIYMDNQSALKLVKNPEFHKRSKHIDVQCHFIREKYQSGELNVTYVSSQKQLADCFTKALSKPRFELLRDCICVNNNCKV